MEKIILSWRILSFFGGWLKYGPGEVRRGTALDDLSASSLQLAESARGPVPLASSSWSGARDVKSWGSTGPRETTTEWTGEDGASRAGTG